MNAVPVMFKNELNFTIVFKLIEFKFPTIDPPRSNDPPKITRSPIIVAFNRENLPFH